MRNAPSRLTARIPSGKTAGRVLADELVEQVARGGAGAAEQPDADEHGEAHARDLQPPHGAARQRHGRAAPPRR